MRVSILHLVSAVCLGLAAIDASAQTIQLPTFHMAGVSTTVMVPDGGAAFLGGINSASDGRSEFGVPGTDFSRFPEPRHRPAARRFQLLGHGHDPRF